MPQVPSQASTFVAGDRGLVGPAVLRRLRADGCTDIPTATRVELDLRDQAAVHAWSAEHHDPARGL